MTRFTSYLAALSHVNRLGEGTPVHWYFHPGMLFLSRDKWWGDFKYRQSIHEGIDITYYKTASGKWCHFHENIRVPALKSGVVLNICDDFLGKTIVAEPFLTIPHTGDPGKRLILAYAHVVPDARLHHGAVMKKHGIIATVSHTRKNPLLPPHLHLSCFEVDKRIPFEHLNWHLFSKGEDVRLLHPVFF